MSYKIKTISELTGIPRPTIVAWERRFDLLGPPAYEGHIRLYSESDLKTLLSLKKMLDNGLRVSVAVEQLKHAA